MKKFACIFAALAAAFTVSCIKEAPVTVPDAPETEVPAGMKKVTLTASVDDIDTKTTYTAEGNVAKFSWTKGDQISVFCSDKNYYTFTADKTGASSTFTGYIPDGISLRNDYAFFPADPGHKRVVDSYYYSIAEEKDLSAAFSADLPMGAIMADGVYVFRHMTGAAHFTFTNVPSEAKYVEIAFQSNSIQLSGEWSTYHSTTESGNKYWNISPKNATTDSQKRFVRKVSVVDNKAQVYLPYPAGGSVWGGGMSITVTGYDESDNEMVLLKDRSVKQTIGEFKRAEIIPIAELALPAYVPPVDWTKVDWTSENVLSIESEKITSVKVLADNYYLYVQVVVPTATEWDRLYYGIAKGTGSAKPWWQWTTSAETAYYSNGTVVDNVLTVEYNDKSVDTYSYAEGDNTYWHMALPRDAHELTQADGEIYFGVMTYFGSNTHTGTAPLRSQPMAVVTLP